MTEFAVYTKYECLNDLIKFYECEIVQIKLNCDGKDWKVMETLHHLKKRIDFLYMLLQKYMNEEDNKND